MTEQNKSKHTYDDWKSDIDDWTDMWDEMQEHGVHPPSAPKAEIAVWDEKDTNIHDMYYTYVADLAEKEGQQAQPYRHHIQQAQEDDLLQEQSSNRIPNPVYPDSVGPDYKTTPPVWASEQILSEIQSLKDRIFELENNLAALGQKKQQWQEKAITQKSPVPISKELERLRDEIERVSNRLGIEHEPSPYVVRRD
jgi:hypothetical protein